MVDPVTVVATSSGIVVTAGMLKRLLGPSFDYLGDRGRDLVQKADENLQTVVRIALDKLRNDVNLPGEVNARVFKNVWDECRFVEDEFAAEYFGGLLASARTDDGRDDSALPFVSLVKSLSTFQLRLHFIVYRLVAQFSGKSKKAKSDRFLDGLHLRIPGDELFRSFDLQDEFEAHLLLALNGLVDLKLIEPHFSLRIGTLHKGPHSQDLEDECLVVAPNERGASLFLRALGSRGLAPELINSIDVDYSLSSTITGAVQIPSHFKFFYSTPNDAIDAVSDEIESLRRELEDVSDKYDDLESAVDKLSDRFEELENDDDATS